MANANNAFGVTIGINPGIGNPGAPYANWTQLFADMAVLSLTWLRFQISWRNIELTQGVYTWTVLDDAVSHCNAQGINILYTIRGAPTWALTTASQKASSKPQYIMDPTLAAGFVTAVMTRYNGGVNGHIDAIGFNEDFNIDNTSSTDTLTLNQQITNAGGPYTQLTITAAANTADPTTKIYVAGFNNTVDVATVSSAVAVGDTVVNINAFTPAVTYNANQVMHVAYVAANNTSDSLLYYPGPGGTTTLQKSQPARSAVFAAPVFNAVATAVRAVNATIPMGLPLVWWTQPLNTNLFPGAGSNYTEFFQKLYTQCAAHIDANTFIDFHYYTNQIAPETGSPQVETITQVMTDLAAVSAANGDAGRMIWCTEFGWQVPQDTDATTQAVRYQDVLTAIIPTNNPNKNKVFFFTLFYGSGISSSLINPDGSHQPAYQTVQTFVANARPQTVNSFGKFMAHA